MPRARRKKKKETRKIAKNRKKSTLRKITKWHILCTGLVLAAYLALGFWLGPEALREDIKGKVAGASTVLSLHISGPPSKPEITTSAMCNDEQSYIGLNWNFTSDTDSYDIYRDGALLVSGITNNYYRDESASYGTIYSYYVIANGPLGNTASDAVSATVGKCIIVKVVAVEGMGLVVGEIPKIKKKDPVFSGITNIPYAAIRVEIHSESLISDLITADENGNWEWKVPEELDYGQHTLYVTAIDANDNSLHKTIQQDFIITGEMVPPPPPPPEDVVCRITTLDNIDLTNFRCLPITKKKTPIFSGTTNVSNAQIQAEISTPSAKRKVISSFTANENGYWFWPVRGQMKKGMKTLYVKSVDPSDSNRFGTCSLRFKVGKAYKKKQLRKCTGATLVQSLSVPPDYNFSEFLDLQFSGPEKFVFAGDDINFKVNLEKAFPAMTSEQKIVFQLVDSQNNSVYQEEKKISPEKDRKIFDSFRVPPYVGSGQYKVITQLMEGDKIITAEKSIEIKEKPIIKLSSNWSLTYIQLLSSLGWIVIILLSLALIFFGLLGLEYHFSQYAVLQVTEKELKNKGYID